MIDVNEKMAFLNEYFDLCVKHKIFINFIAEKTRLEPNPNKKENENIKELSWYAYMMEHIQKLRNNA